MSNRLKKNGKNKERTGKISNALKTLFDTRKIDVLAQYELDDDIEKYINKVHDYNIRIGNRKLTIQSKKDSLDQKYDRLKKVLLKAKEKRINSKNC